MSDLKLPILTITSDGTPWQTKVELNGQPLEAVTRVELVVDAGDKDARPRVRLDFCMMEVALRAFGGLGPTDALIARMDSERIGTSEWCAAAQSLCDLWKEGTKYAERKEVGDG